MCLAIPGQIIEITDAEKHIAKAEVSGVRRAINVSLLEPQQVQVGNWVLIHVGFALSQIDEKEARETYELLQGMGATLSEELGMMDQSVRLQSFEA